MAMKAHTPKNTMATHFSFPGAGGVMPMAIMMARRVE